MLEGNLRFILLKNEEELDIALSIICELKERRRLLRGIERGGESFVSGNLETKEVEG